jgi:signal transduction histidine kinase/ActR/RegA family two-component response regulator
MSPGALHDEAAVAGQILRRRQIHAEQVRLLESNLNLGVGVTAVAVAVLGALQWGLIPRQIIIGWCLYMYGVSLGRYFLGRRYRRKRPSVPETKWWGGAFAIGAGMAGAGWGAAGVLLYPAADLAHQVYLVFVLGGMMLGAASLLAPRREAFLAFLCPAGFAPAVRLVLGGNESHLAMGLLAGVFTIATLVTTNGIHLTILSSLRLRFENQDLIDDLQRAKSEVEVWNERLEARVEARTAELQLSAEALRAEIVQREEVEEELLRARKLESLGVLAGGIAHDLNNFLTVVRGNIDMARMHLGTDGPIPAVLDETETACQRAAFLSSQLLTFAKGGAPVRRVTSVAGLVRDAVQLVRAGAQITVDVAIQEDLRCASVDPSQIGQVLHNILLNARQAMPEGGIIEVRAQNVAAEGAQEADRVRISIRDYGCGIPADVLPRIFDPYFTTKPGGRGLGLATAYTIVAKHGGSLSVESRPGYGAVFTIDLPASREQPEHPVETASPVHTGTERVLVMDDEEPLRKLLASALSSIGYEVRTARDGAEAIALCESAKASGRGFDVALLDLTVSGGMGGLEAAAGLKKLEPSLKMIVSSGYSDAPVMSDFRKYGFDDVLPKPWSVAQLREVFRRVCVPDPDRAT